MSDPSSTSNTASSDPRSQARHVLFTEGLAIRREVVGAAHVERSLASAPAGSFSRPIQEFATESCWSLIWARPGLERRTRSLLNLAMLLALGKSHELGVHVRGAVNNGCSVTEIQETLLHASIYAGLPAGLEGFRVAQRVLEEMGVVEPPATGEATGEKK